MSRDRWEEEARRIVHEWYRTAPTLSGAEDRKTLARQVATALRAAYEERANNANNAECERLRALLDEWMRAVDEAFPHPSHVGRDHRPFRLVQDAASLRAEVARLTAALGEAKRSIAIDEEDDDLRRELAATKQLYDDSQQDLGQAWAERDEARHALAARESGWEVEKTWVVRLVNPDGVQGWATDRVCHWTTHRGDRHLFTSQTDALVAAAWWRETDGEDPPWKARVVPITHRRRVRGKRSKT